MSDLGFGARVKLDPVKLAEVLRGPNGPVVRELLEAGELVKVEAQALVGVYDPPDDYAASARQRKPGTLRDSIVKRFVSEDGAPAVMVGSDDPIALPHHEGTQAHTIAPRSAPLLVFYWRKVGHVVSMRSVNHPGTKPNRFLVNALRVLAGRYRR